MPRLTTTDIRAKLLELFKKHKGLLLKTNEISKMIGIKSSDPAYQLLREALDMLVIEGELIRETRRRYGLPKPVRSVIEGEVRIQPTGNGILTPGKEFELDDTVLIRTRNLSTAMDGDTVRVALLAQKPGERPQGEVIEVLSKRAAHTAIGTLERVRNGFFVKPDTGRFNRGIFVAKRDLHGAKEGDKVKVELYQWEDAWDQPEGIVIEILGNAGAPKTEMDAIIAEYDLPTSFPERVDAEAESFPIEIPSEEILTRLDLRKKIIFTIDPEDAKDFDDAVSLEKNDDGTVTLGVHIADVSHYVRENSELDNESLNRGTSVYLVGTVVPMLPERLSNGLCSLRPDEDKLTYSVFIRLEPETGKVISSEIAKTVIRSVMRFSYEEAELRTTSGKGKYAKLLREMRKLSEVMYAARHEEGSIDFETDEVRFKFNDAGEPVEAYKKERLGSMRMIEDFMLAANRVVAGFIAKKASGGAEKPFLYRIHADPDPAKLRDLSILAKALGYKLPTDNPRPKAIQKFLESLKGKPEQRMLNQLMLRSMAKAVYSESNVGHFGLAFSHYSHFTSPIRRYPDLIVHRMLFEYQQPGGMSAKREHHFRQLLPGIADQTSALERRATEAERESIKVAQITLLRDRVGEEFDAVISGVTHFGLFIQLDSGAEGLLHIRELPGRYTFDEAHYSLVQSPGTAIYISKKSRERGLKRYRIGDPIRVQLVRVMPERRQVDFKLAEG